MDRAFLDQRIKDQQAYIYGLVFTKMTFDRYKNVLSSAQSQLEYFIKKRNELITNQ